MSGSRPQHLQLRCGTYHLRVRVPDELRVRVGLLEIRRSLRVHTLTRARPLALKYGARVMEIFQVVRSRNVSKEVVQALIGGAVCYPVGAGRRWLAHTSNSGCPGAH